MRMLLLFMISMVLTGCTHHQLRYGTIRQADTLSDVFTRQVLDNLAQFSEEPNSLPHFATPREGANSVADTATVGGLALDAFRASAAFGGSRGATESWVLDPVRDPDRLRRMQCAYQKVFGVCGDGCTDCCDVELEFFGRGNQNIQVIRAGQRVLGRNGNPLVDSLSGEPFVDELGNPFPNPRSANGEPYELTNGCVSIPQHDCNGPCSIGCGWIHKGGRFSVPRGCREFSGRYQNTAIWVEPQHRDRLSRLVLLIMDYALNDPRPPITKEVELYVGLDGETVVKEKEAFGKITATIPVGTRNRAILRLDACNATEQDSNLEAEKDGLANRIGTLDASIAKTKTSLKTDRDNLIGVETEIKMKTANTELVRGLKALADNLELSAFTDRSMSSIRQGQTDIDENEISLLLTEFFATEKKISQNEAKLELLEEEQRKLSLELDNLELNDSLKSTGEIPRLPRVRPRSNGSILGTELRLDTLGQ